MVPFLKSQSLMNHIKALVQSVGFSDFKLSILKTVAAFFCILLVAAKAFAYPPIDIVFDLDWTIINPTTEAMAEAVPENTIRIDEKLYRFSDHTFEVLSSLHQIPDVRISYFSGGAAERNHTVIKAIYEKINLLYPNNNFKFNKILSATNLTQVSADLDLKFSQRYKKDLSAHFDLNNAVLVDDIQKFILPGQEKNMLWLGKTYNDRPLYQLAPLEEPADTAYSAPNEIEWRRDRNKLLIIQQTILKAIELSHKNGLSFIENLQRFQSHTKICSSLFL